MGKYIKSLEGERIYLSPVFTDDVEKYIKWLNDLEMTKFLGCSSRNFSIEAEKEILEKLAKDGHAYSIVLKDGDRLIGNTALFDLEQLHQKCTVGLFIGDKEHRGKGYGTEVLKLIVNYGFSYLNLKNIMLKVFSGNEIAYNSYKKVGFKEFGRRRSSFYVKNEWYDEIYMEILKEDFKL